jgi:hypothetical protein
MLSVHLSYWVLILQWTSSTGGLWTYPIQFNTVILGGSRLFYENTAWGTHEVLTISSDGAYHFKVEDMGIRQPTLSNAYLNNFGTQPSFYEILIGV